MKPVKFLQVCVISRRRTTGAIRVGARTFRCILGRNGIGALKWEGDGRTPAATMKLLSMFCRRDRVARIASSLPTRWIRTGNAWCDDPNHRNYNRMISAPLPGSQESLMRDDSAYDYLVILDFNMHPRIKGRGSAIFFHLIRPGASFTAGCIAVSLADMRKILAACGRSTRMKIGY